MNVFEKLCFQLGKQQFSIETKSRSQKGLNMQLTINHSSSEPLPDYQHSDVRIISTIRHFVLCCVFFLENTHIPAHF